MTTTHEAGPHVVFGQASTSGTPEYNPDAGASLFFAGSGILDQRPDTYWQYRPGAQSYQGWLGQGDVLTLSFVPTTLASASIAALQAPTTAVPLTLVTASAAGGIVISASVVNALTGLSVGGLMLLDALTASSTGSITGSTFFAAAVANGTFTVGSVLSGTGVTANTTIIGMAGQGGATGAGTTGTYIITPAQNVSSQVTISAVAGINGVPLIPGTSQVSQPMAGSPLGLSGPKLYNPVAMLGRNVRITTSTSDVAVYTVRGYDIYGYPMTEAITAAGATTVSGKKAFKYIASVTPVGTLGALTSVGTGDVFGLPLASLLFSDVTINFNATTIVASTGYLQGDWSVATSTTGDTRGTYAVQSASDGAKRLYIYSFPMPTNAVSQAGTFGVTQA